MNEIFFELIRVAIGTQDTLTRPPSAGEWKQLYDMAKKQSLEGICFAAVQRLPEDIRPPEMLYLTWMGMAAKIQQRNELMNEYTRKTLEYFRSNGFHCCVLKGQGIAALYRLQDDDNHNLDLSALRQSGDIDVWVNSSRNKLYEFSKKELGKITGLTYHHIHYEMYPDVEVEAHTWPAFFTSPIHNRRFQKFCLQNAPIEGSGDYASLAFNRVFMLQHCFGHFSGHGVGFRQLLDYYFVLLHSGSNGSSGSKVEQPKALNELNSEALNYKQESMKRMSALGMGRFAAALMWLCVEVFGMDKSLSICEPKEKDGRFLLAEVLQTGNMGHQDERVDHRKLQSALGRFLHNIKRDWQIMRIAPSYAMWEPLWGIYQFTWVRITNLRYNR